MNRFTRSVVLALTLGLCLAYGQLTRGFISGTVQDASGAIISEAEVRITNTATNLVRTTVSNETGVYRFVAVEPGTYAVEFVKAGFEQRRVSNITVNTAQEVTLNQTLGVATTSNVVEVSDTPPGVELSKSTPTVQRTLSQQSIVNLPITAGTRDVTQLALLAPTAVRAPGSTGVSANGQRARNNNFLVDGVDNNDPSITVANARVVPESLQEFQVQTSSYSAEYGRNSGAQITAITRSGTNQFHGEAYDYFQGNFLRPVSLSNKRSNIFSTPRFNQNQAGGDLGGPLIKNKTFFFALVEATRRREAPNAVNAASATIPTQAGFATLANLPLAEGQTAASRQAALNSIGFLNGIYPSVSGYSNLRNLPINGAQVQVGTVTIPLANPLNFWASTLRVDHQLRQNDLLTYRGLIDQRSQPDVASNLQFGSLFSGGQEIFRQNHMLTETHIFSPRITNEFRAAYIRGVLEFPENDPKSPTTIITGAFNIGGASNFPQGRVQNTFQYQDSITALLGRHSIKAGVDFRRQRLFNNAAFDSKGTFTFDSLADYINSRPAQLVQSLNAATFDARQWQQFYFVQDDFKATRDLTLNFGLRYEYSDAPFGFFGATTPEVKATRVPGPASADKNNWAPRFGLAYSPSGRGGLVGKLLGDGQTVFRGGYGIGYDVLFFNILAVNGSNYPRVVNILTDRPNLPNIYPTIAPGQAVAFNPTATFVNSPEDLQSPTTHFYSFSIQRQFAKNYIAEAGYSGARSYHGIRQGQTNPGTLTADQVAQVLATRTSANAGPIQSRRLDPRYGSRVSIESTAIGNYNAVYVRLDKRLSYGLTFGANYTFSANLSDNDESLGVADITNSSPQIPQDFGNYRTEYGRSAFDRPHRLALYYNYEVPWFKSGILSNGVLTRVLGGWSVNGITDLQSGQPFTIRTGVDTLGNSSTAARPDYNPNGRITLDPVTGDYRTFITPLDGTGIVVTPLTSTGTPLANASLRPGNLGRNTFRGPGFIQFNFSAQKNIQLIERVRAQIRADFVNLFNHRNFLNPVSSMSSPVFGTNTSDPASRSIILAAKIIF